MLKKKSTTSGQAAKKIPKYKYEEYLIFLNPYLQDRPTFSNQDQKSNSNFSFEDEDLNVQHLKIVEIIIMMIIKR